MRSFNCLKGRHSGCNEFHLGCRCYCHPRAAHLSVKGRLAFSDTDSQLRRAEARYKILDELAEVAPTLLKGRHEA